MTTITTEITASNTHQHVEDGMVSKPTSKVTFADIDVSWEELKKTKLTDKALTARSIEYFANGLIWAYRLGIANQIGKYALYTAIATMILLGGTAIGLHAADVISNSQLVMFGYSAATIIGLGVIAKLSYELIHKTALWYKTALKKCGELDPTDPILQRHVNAWIAASSSWEEFFDRVPESGKRTV